MKPPALFLFVACGRRRPSPAGRSSQTWAEPRPSLLSNPSVYGQTENKMTCWLRFIICPHFSSPDRALSCPSSLPTGAKTKWRRGKGAAAGRQLASVSPSSIFEVRAVPIRNPKDLFVLRGGLHAFQKSHSLKPLNPGQRQRDCPSSVYKRSWIPNRKACIWWPAIRHRERWLSRSRINFMYAKRMSVCRR